MTGIELSQLLENYSYPLPASKRQGIFSLYLRATGVKKVRQCENCANDTFFELKIMAKNFKENEIPLKTIISKSDMNKGEKILKTYHIQNPFRVHGSPKIQDDWNTTDAEVEMLLKINPKLRGHFTRVDGQPMVVPTPPVESVKVVKTSTAESITPQQPSKPRFVGKKPKRSK
jgi:hypothetical protein